MLTKEQIEEFEREGVLVIPDVIPSEILTQLREEYSALLDALYDRWHEEGRVPPPGDMDFWQKLLVSYKAGCDWFQPMDISLPGSEIKADTPFHFGPAVFNMVTCPRLLDLVQDLIGPEITSNPIQHVRMKPPAGNLAEEENRAFITATDWHQDQGVAHAEADETKMVTCWIAVVDATVENGCLQVLREKPEMMPHCPKRQLGIPPRFIDEKRATPLPVPAGGVVVFHPRTPHASLVNNSGQFRWSFDIRFNVTGQPTGRSHFPSFVARSQDHPETVLKDWREWKAMWEEARARLSGGPHIPIHRWRGDTAVCA